MYLRPTSAGGAAVLAFVTGLVHVAVIAPHYFVGSFDDDSGYILGARALLNGQGLTGHLANGAVVAGVYPPGYSALLAPLVWLWPHTFVPLRVLTGLCYATLFPLTWVYLGRRGIEAWPRSAILWLLALSPSLATFGSMVMAETPFLVVFLVWLLVVDRWDRENRLFSPTALGVVLLAGALVWLKEAGLGMVVGLALWEIASCWRPRGRRFAFGRALTVLAGTGFLLLPVLVARLMSGVPIAGSRYSVELGGYYQGGMAGRLLHVVPSGLWQMISTAIGATIGPYLSPIPTSGHMPDLWKPLSWNFSLLAIAGAVIWFRRHRDAAVVIVPVYLAETLLWPYVNERRVILALPVVAAWYVIGAATAWRVVTTRISRRRRQGSPAGDPAAPAYRRVGVVLAGAVVVVPLLLQFPRDYLFNTGQSGSNFQGSRYAGVLARIGVPSDVVETDYLNSTALFTGHVTARSAFDETLFSCYSPGVEQAIARDHAGFLLLGDVNKPGVMDGPCLLQLAGSQPWAVRLLHTSRDDASAYELIGPGTGHPGLRDLVAGSQPASTPSAGGVTYEWDWSGPSPVSQVSLGAAGYSGAGGHTASVQIDIRTANGTWLRVAGVASGVGDGKDEAPFLVVTLPSGVQASGVRVVMRGGGSANQVTDLNVLGPRPAGSRAGA